MYVPIFYPPIGSDQPIHMFYPSKPFPLIILIYDNLSCQIKILPINCQTNKASYTVTCIYYTSMYIISHISGDMEPLREQMASLLIRLKERGGVHPKMKELRNIMCRWVTKYDGNRKKAIVVLEREFSSLSGEILDTFQSIRGRLSK